MSQSQLFIRKVPSERAWKFVSKIASVQLRRRNSLGYEQTKFIAFVKWVYGSTNGNSSRSLIASTRVQYLHQSESLTSITQFIQSRYSFSGVLDGCNFWENFKKEDAGKNHCFPLLQLVSSEAITDTHHLPPRSPIVDFPLLLVKVVSLVGR